MAHLIDKSALAAEIEKLESRFQNGSDEDYADGYHYSLKLVKGILDSLEVKEVDLEKEINDYFITVDLYEGEKITENTFRKIAKHFFELGLKAQKGEDV